MANFLTQSDVDNYGRDLVDFSQRAAAHALGPHLQAIEQQNAELQRRLAIEARRAMDERVEAAIPDYRDIDRDPAWHEFLRTVDPLSGQPRQLLLNDAIAQSDAPRAIAFFRKFQQENQRSHSDQQSHSSRPAPRSAAASRPTPNGTIYTRAQISKLYEQHRRGAYNGREDEWNRLEFDIIRAGAEGRIAGGVDLHGK